jgi:hypothetical protein
VIRVSNSAAKKQTNKQNKSQNENRKTETILLESEVAGNPVFHLFLYNRGRAAWGLPIS